MKCFSLIILFLVSISVLSAREKTTIDTENKNREAGIFRVLEGDTAMELDGVIDRFSLSDFNSLIAIYPNVSVINIKNCPGSSDDEVNLLLSKRVHERGIETHLMDSAIIASGGVDFFIAGVKRTRGHFTQIGVHAWGGFPKYRPKAFPVGHPQHLPYIEYYKSVGFTQRQAEDFYYFTINAAPAKSIHWMTESEISTYNLIIP